MIKKPTRIEKKRSTNIVLPFCVEYLTRAEAELKQDCPTCGAKEVKVLKITHALTLRKILPLFPVWFSKRLFCEACGYQQAVSTRALPKNLAFKKSWTLHKYMGLPLVALFFWGFLQWDKYDYQKAFDALKAPEVGQHYIAYIPEEKAYGAYRIAKVEGEKVFIQIFDTVFEKRADSKLKAGACIAKDLKDRWFDVREPFSREELQMNSSEAPLPLKASFVCSSK